MNDIQTLLVDGYISRTFRSRAAEQYFLDLLGGTFVPPHTILSCAGRECNFFLYYVPSHIPIQHSSPPGCWLLDCGIVDRGTVVPQRTWSPRSPLDRTRHVVRAQLQMPVFFEDEGRSLGISLFESTNGRCRDLRDADQPAPLGPRSSTYIRIVWPGYNEFKRQVPTREPTSTHNPISMASFARRIGRTMETFLQVCEVDPGCADDQRELWRIGPGGIQGGDIVIIGAVHVSAGSWMPVIQLDRYIF